MRLVVDASVALKWFLRGLPNELHVAEAEAVLSVIGQDKTEFFAPGHWIAEVIAVLSRTKPGAVDDALIFLDDMRPIVVAGIPVVKRAAELSIVLTHHLFDTLYHAVALEEQATLVTADEAYFSKAKDLARFSGSAISRPEAAPPPARPEWRRAPVRPRLAGSHVPLPGRLRVQSHILDVRPGTTAPNWVPFAVVSSGLSR